MAAAKKTAQPPAGATDAEAPTIKPTGNTKAVAGQVVFPSPSPDIRPREKRVVRTKNSEYVAGSVYDTSIPLLSALSEAIDDLTADLGNDLYERMSVDAKVAQCLELIKGGAMAQGWRLSPALKKGQDGYANAVEVRDFCQRALSALETPLDSVLYDLLDAVALGNRVAEVIWHVPTRGRLAGQFVPRRIKPKPRENVAFVMDPYEQLQGILGFVPGKWFPVHPGPIMASLNMPNLLPKEKFLILTFRQRGGDPRGRSILRASYTPWWLKSQAPTQWLKFMARWAIPSVWATPGEDAQEQEELDEDGVPVLDQNGQPVMINPVRSLGYALAKWQAGSYGAFPPGTLLNVMEAKGEGAPFESLNDWADRQIELAITLQALASSEGKNGSRSASETHKDSMGVGIQLAKTDAEKAVQIQLLQRLVEWNFGPDALELTPVFSLTETEQADFKEESGAVGALWQNGYLSPSQVPDMDARLGLPERSAEDLAAINAAWQNEQKQKATPPPAPGEGMPGQPGGEDDPAGDDQGAPGEQADGAAALDFDSMMKQLQKPGTAKFAEGGDGQGEHWVMIHGHPVKISGDADGGGEATKAHAKEAAEKLGMAPGALTALNKAIKDGKIKSQKQLWHTLAIAHAISDMAKAKGIAKPDALVSEFSTSVAANWADAGAVIEAAKNGHADAKLEAKAKEYSKFLGKYLHDSEPGSDGKTETEEKPEPVSDPAPAPAKKSELGEGWKMDTPGLSHFEQDGYKGTVMKTPDGKFVAAAHQTSDRAGSLHHATHDTPQAAMDAVNQAVATHKSLPLKDQPHVSASEHEALTAAGFKHDPDSSSPFGDSATYEHTDGGVVHVQGDAGKTNTFHSAGDGKSMEKHDDLSGAIEAAKTKPVSAVNPPAGFEPTPGQSDSFTQDHGTYSTSVYKINSGPEAGKWTVDALHNTSGDGLVPQTYHDTPEEAFAHAQSVAEQVAEGGDSTTAKSETAGGGGTGHVSAEDHAALTAKGFKLDGITQEEMGLDNQVGKATYSHPDGHKVHVWSDGDVTGQHAHGDIVNVDAGSGKPALGEALNQLDAVGGKISGSAPAAPELHTNGVAKDVHDTLTAAGYTHSAAGSKSQYYNHPDGGMVTVHDDGEYGATNKDGEGTFSPDLGKALTHNGHSAAPAATQKFYHHDGTGWKEAEPGAKAVSLKAAPNHKFFVSEDKDTGLFVVSEVGSGKHIASEENTPEEAIAAAETKLGSLPPGKFDSVAAKTTLDVKKLHGPSPAESGGLVAGDDMHHPGKGYGKVAIHPTTGDLKIYAKKDGAKKGYYHDPDGWTKADAGSVSASEADSGAPGASAAPSGPSVADMNNGNHVVEVGGISHTLTDEPASAADVDAVTPDTHGIDLNAKAKEKLKAQVASGEIKTKGDLAQKLAILHAQAKNFGKGTAGQVGGSAVNAVSGYKNVLGLKQAAEGGDAKAQELMAHLGATSIKTPKEAFASLTPEDLLHQKEKVLGGSNSVTLYTTPTGEKHVVKQYVTPTQAWGEHVANSILNELGINAPTSTVLPGAGGKSLYASQFLGDVKHMGLKPSKADAQAFLKGYAANAFLGNWDAIGQTGDNLVKTPSGAMVQVDNGGALLHSAMGDLKPDAVHDSLHEWRNFTKPGVNHMFAKYMAAAGYAKAEDIPGVAGQLAAIKNLGSKYGGWAGLVDHVAPGAPAPVKAKLAGLLEKRAALIEAKHTELVGPHEAEKAKATKFSTNNEAAAWLEPKLANLPKVATDEEKQAVKWWQSGPYKSAASWSAVNQKIWKGQKLKPDEAEAVGKLKSLFAKPEAKIKEHVMLVRGFGLNDSVAHEKASKDLYNSLQAGDTFDVNGIMATSFFGVPDYNKANWESDAQSGYQSSSGWKFIIHAPPGTPMAFMKHFSSWSENEVVLPPGSKFKVLEGVKDVPGKYGGTTKVMHIQYVPEGENS